MNVKTAIKNVYKKIRYGVRASSDSYINYLKATGMSIGERVVIFDPVSTLIDVTRPWLVEIGDDVQITRGVTILTHGYDWSVIKGKYGVVLGSGGGVKIGNNVFIGMNTIILKGVHIGNNVIIGAGSLVNRDVPDDTVVAGNPARVICTIDVYFAKRKKAQLEEAKELVRKYRDRYNTDPELGNCSEFFWLWTSKDDVQKLEVPIVEKMQLLGNYDQTLQEVMLNNKIYNSFKDFLENVN